MKILENSHWGIENLYFVPLDDIVSWWNFFILKQPFLFVIVQHITKPSSNYCFYSSLTVQLFFPNWRKSFSRLEKKQQVISDVFSAYLRTCILRPSSALQCWNINISICQSPLWHQNSLWKPGDRFHCREKEGRKGGEKRLRPSAVVRRSADG